MASDLLDVQGLTANSLALQSDVQLIKTGDKVGASEATLLNMLNISPFSFGLVIQQVFDNGSIYNPVVLDITEETAFPLPGGCPQCSQRMPADWLPDCCHLYPILSSMGTSGSWLCLWRLITPSHLLKRYKEPTGIPKSMSAQVCHKMVLVRLYRF